MNITILSINRFKISKIIYYNSGQAGFILCTNFNFLMTVLSLLFACSIDQLHHY